MMREPSYRLAENSEPSLQNDDTQVAEDDTPDNSLRSANSKENSTQPHRQLTPNSSHTQHPSLAELHKPHSRRREYDY